MRFKQYINESKSVNMGRALDNIQGMLDDKSLEKYFTNILTQLAKNLDKMNKDDVDEKMIKKALKQSNMKKLIDKYNDEVDDFEGDIDELVGYVLESEVQ